MQNKQLSIADIYSNLEVYFKEDKSKFISLLEEYLDIQDFIPASFHHAFQLTLGRKRKYSLHSFICAFLLQNLFAIPTVELVRIILINSRELREFCGFTKVPDASKFTRFKQTFVVQLQNMFDKLVEKTEPICCAIDKELAKTLVYDTTGIETYVSENNDKFVNAKIKHLKRHRKDLETSSIHSIAYGSMPKKSVADEASKLMYINGHFCYAHKYGILTNGLGIVRDIRPLTHIYNDTTPDEEKSISDSKTFTTFMDGFFKRNKNSYNTFLGDAAFDSFEIYNYLLSNNRFKQALIPLQKRSEKLAQPDFDEDGIPLCPSDSTLKMIPIGITGEKNRRQRIKFCCPKSVHRNHSRVCLCENPCTTSKYGRTIHVYPERNLRLYPGIIRGTDEFNEKYKLRTVVERTIQHLKTNTSLTDIRTHNKETIYADMLLAGMSQLFTVILADAIKQQQLFRSVKKLIC